MEDRHPGPDPSSPPRPLGRLGRARRPVFRPRRSWRRHLTVVAYLAAFVVLGVALARIVDDMRSEPASPPTHTHEPDTTTTDP